MPSTPPFFHLHWDRNDPSAHTIMHLHPCKTNLGWLAAGRGMVCEMKCPAANVLHEIQVHLWSGCGNVSLIHWKNCGPKAVLDLHTHPCRVQMRWYNVRSEI